MNRNILILLYLLFYIDAVNDSQLNTMQRHGMRKVKERKKKKKTGFIFKKKIIPKNHIKDLFLPFSHLPAKVQTLSIGNHSNSMTTIYYAFFKLIFNWSRVGLQCCVSFCYTAKLVSYTHTCIYFCFRFYSHIGHYEVMNTVPLTIKQILISYLFYTQQYVYINPNLSVYTTFVFYICDSTSTL